MKSVALLIQLALINQLRATADVNAEEEEAMNQLMDTLMDDEKNDELVDMIAAKLVDKMLGFPMATMPQAAMMKPVPMAQVRNLQNPQYPAMTAPQVNVALVDSGKIDPNADGGRTVESWGTRNRIPKGGVNPYASLVDYPEVEGYDPNSALNALPVQDGSFKTSAAGTKNLVSGFTVQSKVKFPASGKSDKGLEDQVMRSKDFDIRENTGIDVTPDRYKLPGKDSPFMEELDEYDEEPDAITVLAVGIASAFVGSAATFVLFHLHRSLTKTGNTMRAPLLK